MELCGGLAVTEASSEYIWNHIESIFPNNPPPLFQVKIGLDSECVLWTLNPEKPKKSILIRNGVRKIHTIIKDVTTAFPFIQFINYHIEGTSNVADLNSKLPEDLDPIRIIESSIWRNGLHQFSNQDFPLKKDIYLTAQRGKLSWCGPLHDT